MTLSIIVITANPIEKQYAYYEALESYKALADEIVIVDGGTEKFEIPPGNFIYIHEKDPEIWNWSEHAKRLNLGLSRASGDWIIKVDIDWIFKDTNHRQIKRKLAEHENRPVATFQKKTYYPGHRYVQKGEVPIAINKKFKDKIRFGKAVAKYTDLTYPIWWDGRYDEQGVPLGRLVTDLDWGKTGEDFWNFDYTFKTLEKTKELFLRGSKAHKEYFGRSSWGNTEDEALEVFLNNMRGKIRISNPINDLNELPVFIRKRIETLQPEHFGYNGFGML